MHFKVTVFILKVLSGSDPRYWIPPLPVRRESTVTSHIRQCKLGHNDGKTSRSKAAEEMATHARVKSPTPPKVTRRNSQPPASNPSTEELSQNNTLNTLPPQKAPPNPAGSLAVG